mmetsp:Transcript_14767/g.30536  ORF Transcript_14767/g.30536 Transcript_14767/m.30536 type:complete len:85 (+) Transcript_14767:635-889(+)
MLVLQITYDDLEVVASKINMAGYLFVAASSWSMLLLSLFFMLLFLDIEERLLYAFSSLCRIWNPPTHLWCFCGSHRSSTGGGFC